jgi:nicotinamidase-related amidase
MAEDDQGQEGPMSAHAAGEFQPNLSRAAFVVVDMQNDFVRAGAPMEVPDARATIPVIQALAAGFRARQSPVIFTRFVAGPERTLVWNWSPQCAPPTCACWRDKRRTYADIAGERSAFEVVDELSPGPTDHIVDKYGYSAFHNTVLPEILRAEGIETLVVSGTVTQICVEDTVHGAFHSGYPTIVIADAVSSYDRELHAAALRGIAAKFGWVMPSSKVLAALASSASDHRLTA